MELSYEDEDIHMMNEDGEGEVSDAENKLSKSNSKDNIVLENNISSSTNKISEGNLVEKLTNMLKQGTLEMETLSGKDYLDFAIPKFNGKYLKDLTVCKKCQKIFSTPNENISLVKRHKGTAGHLKMLEGSEKRGQIEKYFNPPLKEEVKISLKKQFGIQLATVFSTDLLSFNLVNLPGFNNMVRYLINIGAQHGPVDLTSIMPADSTLRQIYLEEAYIQTLEKLKVRVKHLKDVSVCVDIWFNKLTWSSYLGVSAQYVKLETDENGKFIKIKIETLCPGIILLEGKKDYKNCYDSTFFILNNVFNNDCKFTFTTDKGGNLVKAFKNFENIRCISHGINNVIQELFKIKKTRKSENINVEDEIDADYEGNEIFEDQINIEEWLIFEESDNEVESEIISILKFCKKLVTKFKQKGWNVFLEKSLKNPVKTRFNTIYIMLESIISSFEGATKILIDDKNYKDADKLKKLKIRY
jgi:hypothetical protein